MNGVNFVFLIPSFLLFALLIVAVVYAVKRKEKKLSGKLGEETITSLLQTFANKYGGYVIDDVIIPSGWDSTAQIDAIYVSPKCIFVVEVKDYSGQLYGNDFQKEWTQVLAYGNVKNKMYNPIMQNKTHVDALSRIVKYPGDIISCVVILSADLSGIKTHENVFGYYGFKHFIKETLKSNRREYDYERYYNIIKKYKDNPIKTSEEHTQEIKTRSLRIDNNCCPYCGVPLVLRHSSTGRSFYGCPNYPKCKFTKKQ